MRKAQAATHALVGQRGDPEDRVGAFTRHGRETGDPQEQRFYAGAGKVPIPGRRAAHFGIDGPKMWCRLVGSLATKCRSALRLEGWEKGVL